MKPRAYSILDNPIASTIILLFVLGAVVIIWILVPHYFGTEYSNISERGSYGDTFGAVNALFTGLAFAGLIFTIFLQQREIKLQREDFIEQLEEMRLARGESAKLAQIQQKQLDLGLAELKMKSLEAEIAYLQMESLMWREGSRFQHIGPKLLEVKKEMDEIVEKIES